MRGKGSTYRRDKRSLLPESHWTEKAAKDYSEKYGGTPILKKISENGRSWIVKSKEGEIGFVDNPELWSPHATVKTSTNDIFVARSGLYKSQGANPIFSSNIENHKLIEQAHKMLLKHVPK